MCTGEQWLRKHPLDTMQIGGAFIRNGAAKVKPPAAPQSYYWLSPLFVPKGVRDYFRPFPAQSVGAVMSHWPAVSF